MQAALDTHARYVPEMSRPAIATLAELRVRQGRLLDAERLLAGGLEQPVRLRPMALLRLAEGRPGEAVTCSSGLCAPRPTTPYARRRSWPR